MRRPALLLVAAVVAASMFGCGGTATGASGNAGSSAATTSNTTFPMPASVSNLTDTGNGSINFQTKTSLQDTIAFYREALTKAGLTERTINTAITDTTFSLVFDGDPSGKAVVVQGVDLGNGTTNVNIRYEDV
jgi:hypothetical protein